MMNELEAEEVSKQMLDVPDVAGLGVIGSKQPAASVPAASVPA